MSVSLTAPQGEASVDPGRRPADEDPSPDRSAAPWTTSPGGRRWCAGCAVDALVDHLGRTDAAGGRVLVCDRSTPETALLLLALMHLGCSVVLLDPGAPPARVRSAVAQAACRAVVGEHPGLTGSEVTLLGDAAGLVAALPPARACTGHPDADRRAGLAAWVARADALVMWTSGSTGEPRGLTKSGRAVLANTEVTADVMGYRTDDVLLPLLPVTHQYGMSLVLVWWLVGCGLVLDGHRPPAALLRSAAPLDPTVVDAVPAFYAALVASVRAGAAELPTSVRMWCVGGAPLPPVQAEAFAAVAGAPLLDGYGSTEAGNVALATLEDPVDLGKPLPGVLVEVRRPDGSTCAVGEAGRVHVLTPHLYSATLAEGSAGPTGWFDTGDLGALDERGRLRVLGRASAVHRCGHTIYPAELVRAAVDHGVVLEVVALPDERLGAHLTAVVVDASGRPPAWWRERLETFLPTYELPNRVLVVPELPRLATGKADLVGLRDLAAAARRPGPAGL